MSRYYKQMQHGSDEARQLLQERLAREEMGDEAYDKMVSNNGDQAFKIVGGLFIIIFAAIVTGIVALGY